MNGDDYSHRRRLPRITADTSKFPKRPLRLTINSNPTGTSLYLNGEPVATSAKLHLTLPSEPESGRLLLGNTASAGQPWLGVISFVSLLPRSLTAGEVASSWRTQGALSPSTSDALLLFRFEEAAALLPGVIETLTAANGLDHPDTLSARAYFVSALRDSEREQEALEESLGLVETLINSNGPDHPRTIEGQMQLFPLLVSGGRDEDADALLTDLIERFPRVMGKDHVNIMSLYGNGAQVATALGDHERANELSAFAERKARTMLPEKHPALGPMLMIRASTLRNLGLTRDEMTVLEEAFFQFTTIEPKDLGRAARAARQLAGAARQLDDPEAADRWGAEADRLDGR